MSSAFPFLKGKKGIVVGIANENSIAYGCAKQIHKAGAEIVLGYGTEKSEPYIQPLLAGLGNPDLILCDVTDDAQLENLFQHAKDKWGRIDYLVQSKHVQRVVSIILKRYLKRVLNMHPLPNK